MRRVLSLGFNGLKWNKSETRKWVIVVFSYSSVVQVLADVEARGLSHLVDFFLISLLVCFFFFPWHFTTFPDLPPFLTLSRQPSLSSLSLLPIATFRFRSFLWHRLLNMLLSRKRLGWSGRQFDNWWCANVQLAGASKNVVISQAVKSDTRKFPFFLVFFHPWDRAFTLSLLSCLLDKFLLTYFICIFLLRQSLLLLFCCCYCPTVSVVDWLLSLWCYCCATNDDNEEGEVAVMVAAV